MVFVIASAPEAKARIAPDEAVITNHFVGITYLSEFPDQSIRPRPLC
jgi:hypothetical protein